jgi:hypothetical protein
MWSRGRFRELVGRQLDLFAEDEAGLVAEARAAEQAWNDTSAEDAEELYGDYQLVVDAIGDRLHDIRETYAASLEDDVADEYRRTFDRTARKRFGRLASFLDERW